MAHAAPADENGVSDLRKEDRASPRPRIQAELTVDGEVSGGGPCDVKDLSRSGICVVTRDPIAPGRAVHIQLRGPGARIALIGQIVWVRPAGQSRFEIGCWHVPDGAESRERLEQLVREFQTPLSTP